MMLYSLKCFTELMSFSLISARPTAELAVSSVLAENSSVIAATDWTLAEDLVRKASTVFTGTSSFNLWI